MAVGSVWIPVYPGAHDRGHGIRPSRTAATESTLNFETKDQADRVLSFYQAALKKGVFRFDTVTKSDGGGTVRSMAHAGKNYCGGNDPPDRRGFPGRDPDCG